MIDFSILAASLRISVPYAAGALGATITERSGTVNIAIEGFMLTGAFAYACASYYCQVAWLPSLSSNHAWIPLVCGLSASIVAAMLLSLVHALTTLVLKSNQIVSGLAINFLALGITDFLLQKLFSSASNSPQVPTFPSWGVLDESHGANWINSLFHPILFLLIGIMFGAYWILNRTRLGLRMRAAGENPLAASAAGVNPVRYRLYGILGGAACAAIGGVWLVSEQGLFSSNMTAGRGYIALAAMILGRWKVGLVGLVCIFFGFAEALQNILQVSRQAAETQLTESAGLVNLERLAAAIPTQLIQALPYILTLIVVAGFGGRTKAPAAVGQPLTND